MKYDLFGAKHKPLSFKSPGEWWNFGGIKKINTIPKKGIPKTKPNQNQNCENIKVKILSFNKNEKSLMCLILTLR